MDTKDIKSSTKFCHYTTIDSARNILSSNCFYLSKFNYMNDLKEAKLHRFETDNVFSLSFCNSDSINIPLFYLYSGIDGKGCRIQFTDAKIREIVKNCKVHYVNKSFKVLKKEINPSEYDILFDWIYYTSTDGFCSHKHDDDKKYQSIDEAIDTLQNYNKHYFIKKPIWKFENEFRIIIKFKSPVKYDRISLDFNIKENEKSISVLCAPEINDAEYIEIADEFRDYDIHKVNRSSDYGVSMNLLKKNEEIFEKWKK